MKNRKLLKILIGALIFLALLIWAPLVKSPTADVSSKDVAVDILDVGQGDAILIQKGTFQILIDGGPDQSVLSRLGENMPLTDRKIEMMILSHPHADHLTGLREVLDRYQVDQIYYSGVSYDANGYKEFLDKVATKKIPIVVPTVGEKENVFENGELTFLWPGTAYIGQTIENLNDSSEVVKFCYFTHCALFPGDIEQAGRDGLLSLREKGLVDPKAELLKIAHHGSVNGTDQAFLDAVTPLYAAISVGKDNKYGHPHAPTLTLLDANKIKYFRTDQIGTIKFEMSEAGISRQPL